MSKKQNPAGGGTPGGAGNVVAVSASLPKQYSPRRRQRQRRPAAPAFALSRPVLKYGPLPPLWRVAFSDGRELLMCTDTLHALPRFRREARERLGIDYPAMSLSRWFDTMAEALRQGGSS